MPVQEKSVPRFLSLSATFASVGVCLCLWILGNENPRKFVANKAINHHSRYGPGLECYDCHAPAGGRNAFSTSLTCATAACHGDLQPNKPPEEARAEFIAANAEKYIADGPRIAERADHYLALHAAVREQSCWSCHSEHTSKAHPDVPEGWKTFNQMSANENRRNKETQSVRKNHKEQRSEGDTSLTLSLLVNPRS